MSKREELEQAQRAGNDVAKAGVGAGILGTIFAIASVVNEINNSSEITRLENENNQLRARNDELQNGLFGPSILRSAWNGDEIDANNRKIAENNERIRKLKK